MIYLELFCTFFLIGAFTFGGGFGMIALIRDAAIANGWLTEAELLQIIAVSESTPGPIAVNMATFVGGEQAGILGATVATLGVVLPSFIIILIVAIALSHFLENRYVRALLSGVRPTVVGLILGTALTMLLSRVLGFTSFAAPLAPDARAAIILALLALGDFLFRRLGGKRPSPLFIILLSAGLGLLTYGLT